jgi:hypothetical protein
MSTTALNNRLQQASATYRTLAERKASGTGPVDDGELADVLERLGLTDANFDADVSAIQRVAEMRGRVTSDADIAALASTMNATSGELDAAEREWNNTTRPRLQSAASAAYFAWRMATDRQQQTRDAIASVTSAAPRVFDVAPQPAAVASVPREASVTIREIPVPFRVGQRVRLVRAAHGLAAGTIGAIQTRPHGDQFTPSYRVTFDGGAMATVAHGDLAESFEPVEMMGVSETRLPGVVVC